MSAEASLLEDSFVYMQHALADICLALQAIERAQRRILDELRQREDCEHRLCSLERLVHAAIMSGEEDDGHAYS